MYAKCFKRLIDFVLSFCAMIVLSPILLILTVTGAVAMGENPFFTQQRPGKDEKIFRLIKFRTMNNKKDKDGNLLPDEKRLTGYGKWLRGTSLDELPELFNILIGDMSLVGPRPLLPQYLPYYTETEKHRHDVRPGLTGLAQVNGRNYVNWDQRLAYDVKYVENLTFAQDIQIIIDTIIVVFAKDGVSVDSNVIESYLDEERAAKQN